MRYLVGAENDNAHAHFLAAAEEARRATCTRARCGTIIVSGDEVIGIGANTPPHGLESQRRCSNDKMGYDKKVTDKTCCVHAEQRAIMDALSRNPTKLPGSRLYFTRIDEHNVIVPSGKPYCTICSKMTLDAGIAEFVLLHNDGICVYDAEEYNDLSYKYSRGEA